MHIDLPGSVIALHGARSPIIEVALAALRANGGRLLEDALAEPVDILLVSSPLTADGTEQRPGDPYSVAREMAVVMAERGGGRILFVVSALAGMPMRRHPELSMQSASILTGVRTLAMEFGPKVLVNAVGLGAIQTDALIAGDAAMLTHTPLGRAGSVDEAVAAVLFFCDPLNTYTTGQMLTVDGGWTAGYGRNF